MTERSERPHFPQAVAPDHLVGRTLETAPLGEVFFISPGDSKDYDYEPTIFVTDGKLVVSNGTELSADDRWPSEPPGLVAIMRTCVISNGTIREHIVADLRGIDSGSLPIDDPTDMEDQEEYMAWVRFRDNCTQITGFIAEASEHDEDEDDELPIPLGATFGPEELLPALAALAKTVDEVWDRYVERLKQPAETEAEEEISDTETMAELEMADSEVVDSRSKQSEPPKKRNAFSRWFSGNN